MKKLFLALSLVSVLLLTGCSNGDKTAQNGDVLVIDFEGKLNGVAFENGAAKNYAMFLGEAGFIDGFEEQLVGMKTGEKKTITVTFPKNYGSEELAGKECTFDIVLHKIYKEVK